MMSKWYVHERIIDGRTMYAAARRFDDKEPESAGNMQTFGNYMRRREAVQALVDDLNGIEVESDGKGVQV